jgi:hypothetical protein
MLSFMDSYLSVALIVVQVVAIELLWEIYIF